MAPYIDHDLCFKTLTSKYLAGTYTVGTDATAMRLAYLGSMKWPTYYLVGNNIISKTQKHK